MNQKQNAQTWCSLQTSSKTIHTPALKLPPCLTLCWTAGHICPIFHFTFMALLLRNKACAITYGSLAPSIDCSRSFCMHFCDIATRRKYARRQAEFFCFLRPRPELLRFCELHPKRKKCMGVTIVFLALQQLLTSNQQLCFVRPERILINETCFTKSAIHFMQVRLSQTTAPF